MTDRLNLLTSGFVLAISLVVLLLLSRYTKEVIRDESVDITHQTLENIAQRIDNKLQLTDMTANLEQQTVNIDKTTIEKLIREGNYILALNQKLPNARLMVADNATTSSSTTASSNTYFTNQFTTGDTAWLSHFP